MPTARRLRQAGCTSASSQPTTAPSVERSPRPRSSWRWPTTRVSSCRRHRPMPNRSGCTGPPSWPTTRSTKWSCWPTAAASPSNRRRRAPTFRSPRFPTVRSLRSPTSATSRPSGLEPGEPLGLYFGARSGDKGGNANVGIWAADAAGYAWLAANLSADSHRQPHPRSRRSRGETVRAAQSVGPQLRDRRLPRTRGCVEHRVRFAGQRPRRVPPQPNLAQSRIARSQLTCFAKWSPTAGPTA